MSLADYVISVDTSAFHLAGGLKKPLMGIFTFADGKVYGKYFNFVLVQKHRDNGNWDCGPCYNFSICPKSPLKVKPCLTELKYDDFMIGIQKLLQF
jgi:ADP-heptose:LPS heptosyltransferase